MTPEEKQYLTDKLYDGYFSFEASNNRDWNRAVCGFRGVAPIFESGDGNCKNCTPLKCGKVVQSHHDLFLLVVMQSAYRPTRIDNNFMMHKYILYCTCMQ